MSIRLDRRSLLLGALAAPAFIDPARAQSTLVLASGYPDGNFQTRTLRWFAARAKELSNGGVDITIHSNASLIRLPEIRRAVQSGQVQIGEILLGNHGNEDAIFEADSVPFLAAGYAEARTLYAAQKPMLESRLGRQGQTLLYSVAWPGNGFFSRRELTKLSDLGGMKVRTYNALTQRLVEYFKAISVIVQVPDLPQAFLTGVAEAMITSTPVLVNGKSWEYGRFWYHLQAFNPRNGVIMNTRALAALPRPHQDAIRQAAAEAEPRGWQLSETEDKQNLVTLTENGVRVITATDDMRVEMRAAGEALIGPWAERAGPDGLALKRAMGR
jgi:TRAP-type C4-dicarboxylate transport system substrate-binding protein